MNNGEKIRIAYGSNEHQFGDLRLPNSEGPHPVIIIIHGGFWRAQTGLEIMDDIANDLNSKGIATWNIEYRRVGHEGGGWPGTFIDVASAADYLINLEQPNHLDLSRVITLGHSAGGHLALWLGARHQLPADSPIKGGNKPLKIKGALSLAGVSDLALMEEVHNIREAVTKNQDNPVRDLLKEAPTKDSRLYAQTSPVEMLPMGIPQVLVHGSLDVSVPIGISYSYKKVADKVNDDVRLVEIPSAEHFKVINPKSEAWPIIVENALELLKA